MAVRQTTVRKALENLSAEQQANAPGHRSTIRELAARDLRVRKRQRRARQCQGHF
jgi:hypothetical protein